MNKIYDLNIDMLRLCYEIKEPNNINIIKTKEVGEEIDFMYFYLRRIEGKHFKFVCEIRYNDMGKDKLFGELRLGINDDEEASNIHTNGYNKFIDYAFAMRSNLFNLWELQELEGRRRLQKLVFPDGFIYDKNNEHIAPLKPSINSFY